MSILQLEKIQYNPTLLCGDTNESTRFPSGKKSDNSPGKNITTPKNHISPTVFGKVNHLHPCTGKLGAVYVESDLQQRRFSSLPDSKGREGHRSPTGAGSPEEGRAAVVVGDGHIHAVLEEFPQHHEPHAHIVAHLAVGSTHLGRREGERDC